MKSNYLNFSELFNLVEILFHDGKHTSVFSDQYSLKTHIFEEKFMFKTDFRARQFGTNFCKKTNISNAHRCIG